MGPEDPNHLIEAVAADYEADLVFYCGQVVRPKDDALIDLCPANKSRKNVLLLVTTFGGNPHAAYRMTRTLQKHYSRNFPGGEGKGKMYAFVDSACASAGTLMVMGADELILSDHAELGPIDMQLKKPDEVGERISGLTSLQALEYLDQQSRDMFNNHFLATRAAGFATTTASKIAADLTTGLLGNLYSQIDPIRVADNFRFLSIAEHYGERICRNLKPDALGKLVRSYPSHEFVIDPTEARELFNFVSSPKPSLVELAAYLKPIAERYLYSNDANICYLTEPLAKSTPPDSTPQTNSSGNGQHPHATPPAPSPEHAAEAGVARAHIQ